MAANGDNAGGGGPRQPPPNRNNERHPMQSPLPPPQLLQAMRRHARQHPGRQIATIRFQMMSPQQRTASSSPSNINTTSNVNGGTMTTSPTVDDRSVIGNNPCENNSTSATNGEPLASPSINDDSTATSNNRVAPSTNNNNGDAVVEGRAYRSIMDNHVTLDDLSTTTHNGDSVHPSTSPSSTTTLADNNCNNVVDSTNNSNNANRHGSLNHRPTNNNGAPPSNNVGVRVRVHRIMPPHPRRATTTRQPQPGLRPGPLRPEQVEHRTPRFRGDDDDENTFWNCLICLDVVQNPHGCGNEGCPARFCLACLTNYIDGEKERLHRELIANGESPTGARVPCPCCRTLFAERARMFPDYELQLRLVDLEVECPYGCSPPGTMFRMRDWPQHERLCPRVVVACRFQKFGCLWTGPRETLENHDCALAHLEVLIQYMRQQHATQAHAIRQLEDNLNTTQRQLAATQQLWAAAHNHLAAAHQLIPDAPQDGFESESERLVARNEESEHDVLHILELTYLSTCFPSRFRDTGFFRLCFDPHARGAVYNFLSLLPTAIQSTKIAASGFRLLLGLLDGPTHNILDVALEIILATCILSLCFVTMAIFFLNGYLREGSELEWEPTNIQLMDRTFQLPVMQYLAGVALVVLHSAFGVWYGFKNLVLSFLVLVTSLLFPTMVVTNLERAHGIRRNVANNPITPANVLERGRALLVVLFGLRYGVLFECLGFLPVLEALLLYVLIIKCLEFAKRHFGMELLVLDRFKQVLCLDLKLLDPVWDKIKITYIFPVAVAREVAALSRAWRQSDGLLQLLAVQFGPLVLALFALPLFNTLVQVLLCEGTWMGEGLAHATAAPRQILTPEEAMRRRYSIMGVLAFTSWMLMLGAIVVS